MANAMDAGTVRASVPSLAPRAVVRADTRALVGALEEAGFLFIGEARLQVCRHAPQEARVARTGPGRGEQRIGRVRRAAREHHVRYRPAVRGRRVGTCRIERGETGHDEGQDEHQAEDVSNG